MVGTHPLWLMCRLVIGLTMFEWVFFFFDPFSNTKWPDCRKNILARYRIIYIISRMYDTI